MDIDLNIKESPQERRVDQHEQCGDECGETSRKAVMFQHAMKQNIKHHQRNEVDDPKDQ